MDEKGVTGKELSFRADIAQSTTTNLYKGEMKRIDLPVFDCAAATLGVSFKDLFGTTEDEALQEEKEVLIWAN
jgi:transcriptional regulator with XRE-family HTH domain